jgi:Ni,Fe-hydrogenase I large subunit
VTSSLIQLGHLSDHFRIQFSHKEQVIRNFILECLCVCDHFNLMYHFFLMQIVSSTIRKKVSLIEVPLEACMSSVLFG